MITYLRLCFALIRYRIWLFFGGKRTESGLKLLSRDIIESRGMISDLRKEILDLKSRVYELEGHDPAELDPALEAMNEYRKVVDKIEFGRGKTQEEIDKLKADFIETAANFTGSVIELDLLTFDDAILIARGCMDYGGGYHLTHEREIFHHGIQTVINALNGSKKSNLSDLQSKTLHRMGKDSCPENSAS